MQPTTKVLAEIERLVPLLAGLPVDVAINDHKEVRTLTHDGARQVLVAVYTYLDDIPVVEPDKPFIHPNFGRNY